MLKSLRIAIEDKLFNKFKSACYKKGLTVKEVITGLVKKWIKEK